MLNHWSQQRQDSQEVMSYSLIMIILLIEYFYIEITFILTSTEVKNLNIALFKCKDEANFQLKSLPL